MYFLGQVTCGEVSSGSEFVFTNIEYPAAVPNETQHCSLQVRIVFGEKIQLSQLSNI